jgi:hypothetical protein
LKEHGSNLFNVDNILKFGHRTLFGKEVIANLSGSKFYVYLMLDLNKFGDYIYIIENNNYCTDEQKENVNKDIFLLTDLFYYLRIIIK